MISDHTLRKRCLRRQSPPPRPGSSPAPRGDMPRVRYDPAVAWKVVFVAMGMATVVAVGLPAAADDSTIVSISVLVGGLGTGIVFIFMALQ
jgi:hypothetical protein